MSSIDGVDAMLRRPKRADARRNYDALLAAAADAFAQLGTEVPLDEVARRAGVGNATLYRNFPTRRDLIVAVCVDEVEALIDFGAQVGDDADSAAALRRWMERFIEHFAANKGLAGALISGGAEGSAVVERCNTAIRGVVTTLLSRAQAQGVVGDGVETDDLVSAAQALALVAESDGIPRAHRILGLVLAGAGSQ